MGVPGRKPNVGADAAAPGPYVPTGDKNLVLRDKDGNEVLSPELLSEGGAAIWAVLLPDLIKTGVFRESDTILLVELCETLASAQDFRRQVRGLMGRLEDAEARAAAGEEDADRDAEVLSTRVKRARAAYLQSMKLVMSIAGEFGISPVARLRLGLMRVQGATLLGALGGDDG